MTIACGDQRSECVSYGRSEAGNLCRCSAGSTNADASTDTTLSFGNDRYVPIAVAAVSNDEFVSSFFIAVVREESQAPMNFGLVFEEIF